MDCLMIVIVMDCLIIDCLMDCLIIDCLMEIDLECRGRVIWVAMKTIYISWRHLGQQGGKGAEVASNVLEAT